MTKRVSPPFARDLPFSCKSLDGFGERLVGIYAKLLRLRLHSVLRSLNLSGSEQKAYRSPSVSGAEAFVFPRCRCLHTFLICRKLLVVFVSDTGGPLQWYWSRPWGVYFCAHASHAIEIDWQALSVERQGKVKAWLVEEGTRSIKYNRSIDIDGQKTLFGQANSLGQSDSECEFNNLASTTTARLGEPSGYSLIEALLAMPVVLLMGLLVVQLGLLAQQALTVNYAVGQAVRELGAAGGSLTKGLALGLSPLLLKNSSAVGSLSAAGQVLATSQAALASARLQGWVGWQVLEPKPETFYDWGLGTDQLIIPPSWVKHELSAARPRSGSVMASNASASLASGQRSGVDRLDASKLRVRFVVGLPLNMPLAGPLLAKAVAWSRGCSNLPPMRLGAVQLGAQSLTIYSAQGSLQELAHDCLLLKQGGFNASSGPRLPVRFEVTAQAQSVLDPLKF